MNLFEHVTEVRFDLQLPRIEQHPASQLSDESESDTDTGDARG